MIFSVSPPVQYTPVQSTSPVHQSSLVIVGGPESCHWNSIGEAASVAASVSK